MKEGGTAPGDGDQADAGLRIGAIVQQDGVFFRVWAPLHRKVEVVLENGDEKTGQPLSFFELTPEGDGYFSRLISEAAPGSNYRYRLGAGDEFYSDPASRFQPKGPNGPSEVIDPAAFEWSDREWSGIDPRRHVLYEVHVGTFTQEGTWQAASEQLTDLKDVGITTLQIMPLADFAGRFGWGYDGVNLFAPSRLYGRPDDFRAFVYYAHALGLAVILDVVYNHAGPEGNSFKHFSQNYFSTEHTTDWGEGFNFDGDNSGPVRDFFVANARYWVKEFHVDGLRLDATHNIYDCSPLHILSEIT
jgi:maltooligosyltrehalose trehalohydrolase